jgi:hypothetical protein
LLATSTLATYFPTVRGLILCVGLFTTACILADRATAQSAIPMYSQGVAEILADVSSDTLMRRVRELCGEVPVVVNDSIAVITNRYDGTEEKSNELAGDYLEQKLSQYGLHTESHRFQDRGRNIVAVQKGSLYPDIDYIICGHYDASHYAYPGADDNASGSAAVLEAARLLSRHTFEYSIVYILWDAEERGLVGSRFYAESARMRGDSILGVINLDMISWDSDDDMRASLEYNLDGGLPLVWTMQSVNNTYDVGLDLYTRFRSSTPSDNYSFTRFDYPSFLFIEDWSDFNLYYHGVGDTPSEINLPFFTRITQVAIGGLAILAGMTEPLALQPLAALPDAALLTPSPHPMRGLTQIRFSLPRRQHVRLELFDVVGRRVALLADMECKAGPQHVPFDASSLQRGAYLLRMSTESGAVQRVLLKGE